LFDGIGKHDEKQRKKVFDILCKNKALNLFEIKDAVVLDNGDMVEVVATIENDDYSDENGNEVCFMGADGQAYYCGLLVDYYEERKTYFLKKTELFNRILHDRELSKGKKIVLDRSGIPLIGDTIAIFEGKDDTYYIQEVTSSGIEDIFLYKSHNKIMEWECDWKSLAYSVIKKIKGLSHDKKKAH